MKSPILNLRKFFFAKKGNEHQLQLDGVRSFSALFIIFFHVFFFSQYLYTDLQVWLDFVNNLPFYLGWLRRGDYAVDVFFLLSAFLIGGYSIHSHVKANKDVKKFQFKMFYLKRFFRIYPIYILVLSIYLLVDGFDANVIFNIMAVNNIFNVVDMVIPWSWTIAVEIQFYIVCPFIIFWLLASRTPLIPLITLVLISLCWNLYFLFANSVMLQESYFEIIQGGDKDKISYIATYFYVNTISRFYAFTVGLGAAYFWYFYKEQIAQYVKQQQLQAKVIIVFVVGLLFLKMLPNPFLTMDEMSAIYRLWYWYDWVAGRLVFSILFIIIMLYSLILVDGKKNLIGSFFSNRFLTQFADISLSAYLMHPFYIVAGGLMIGVADGQANLVPEWQLLLVYLLVLAMAYLFGMIAYHLLEKHFISQKFKQTIAKVFYKS